MVNKVLLPSEVDTYYIIPSLRRHLTLYLKEQGMKQKDIAAIFGINTAAVSQYNTKRGQKVTFEPQVTGEIQQSAQRIKDHFTYVQETQRLLRLIRSTPVYCRIHQQFSEVPLNCNLAAMGCHL